ncbi:hypothetical protein COO60DRAFT_7037 [Scenedesmus sp. NREL 46B-D3]|nr:hypothetical protein COO60DRAFT_7037 [Scenedesmus sp. NREL 46B-D3]
MHAPQGVLASACACRSRHLACSGSRQMVWSWRVPCGGVSCSSLQGTGQSLCAGARWTSMAGGCLDVSGTRSGAALHAMRDVLPVSHIHWLRSPHILCCIAGKVQTVLMQYNSHPVELLVSCIWHPQVSGWAVVACSFHQPPLSAAPCLPLLSQGNSRRCRLKGRLSVDSVLDYISHV